MNPKWKSVNKIKNERNKSGVVGRAGSRERGPGTGGWSGKKEI